MADRVTRKTTSHRVIRKWVESRKGKPATVAATAGKEPGVLRIDFPGGTGEGTLEEVPWEAFFEKFDEAGLVFIYQDYTAGGKPSRFCKLVSKESAGKKKAAAGDDKPAKKAAPKKAAAADKDKKPAAKAKPAAARTKTAADKKPAAKPKAAGKAKPAGANAKAKR